jgi:hypothetical protein
MVVAMIAIVSAKTSPGATTTAVALAVTWPTPALLVGADPGGDDVIAGYLGPWIERGWVMPGKGVVSFAVATRRVAPGQIGELAPHTQLLPGGRNARVLLGVSEPVQTAAVGPVGWQRLTDALTQVSRSGTDVIADCGRFGPATPRPVLEAADLVLVAVRSQRRSVIATRPLVRLLRQLVRPDQLGLAVVAAGPEQAEEASEVLTLPIGVRLPEDPLAARAFSDATSPPPRRSPLVRHATAAGTRLHHALNQPQPQPQMRLVGAQS